MGDWYPSVLPLTRVGREGSALPRERILGALGLCDLTGREFLPLLDSESAVKRSLVLLLDLDVEATAFTSHDYGMGPRYRVRERRPPIAHESRVSDVKTPVEMSSAMTKQTMAPMRKTNFQLQGTCAGWLIMHSRSSRGERWCRVLLTTAVGGRGPCRTRRCLLRRAGSRCAGLMGWPARWNRPIVQALARKPHRHDKRQLEGQADNRLSAPPG